jgi:hypothetical protein
MNYFQFLVTEKSRTQTDSIYAQQNMCMISPVSSISQILFNYALICHTGKPGGTEIK